MFHPVPPSDRIIFTSQSYKIKETLPRCNNNEADNLRWASLPILTQFHQLCIHTSFLPPRLYGFCEKMIDDLCFRLALIASKYILTRGQKCRMASSQVSEGTGQNVTWPVLTSLVRAVSRQANINPQAETLLRGSHSIALK